MIKINSLWIGDPLSTLERLCMASHLKNGHEYHLWTYGPLDVPEGVILEDGNEILPESEIFCYSGPKEEGGGSVSAFSNLFRYKLLSQRDEWWCDTDVVAIKPFDFEESCVFASEALSNGSSAITTCVIKGSGQCMSFCEEQAQRVDRATVGWGTIGPKLLAESVFRHDLEKYVVPPAIFCPVDYWDIEKFLLKREIPNSYAIHLWNEMWRRNNIDKDGEFPSDCLYETLKKTYGCGSP